MRARVFKQISGEQMCGLAITKTSSPEHLGHKRGGRRHNFEAYKLGEQLLRTEMKNHIIHKPLRNLDNTTIADLTTLFNECWAKGRTPTSMEDSHNRFHSKSAEAATCRSLPNCIITSCLSKLLEHVVLARLNRQIEKHDLLPHFLLELGPPLFTQDGILQLKHHIVYGRFSFRKYHKAILRTDVKPAFDSVSHSATLDGVAAAGVCTNIQLHLKLSNSVIGRMGVNSQWVEQPHPSWTIDYTPDYPPLQRYLPRIGSFTLFFYSPTRSTTVPRLHPRPTQKHIRRQHVVGY